MPKGTEHLTCTRLSSSSASLPLLPSSLLDVRNGTNIRAQALGFPSAITSSLTHLQVQPIPKALGSTCYIAFQSIHFSWSNPSPGWCEHHLLYGFSDSSSLDSSFQFPSSLNHCPSVLRIMILKHKSNLDMSLIKIQQLLIFTIYPNCTYLHSKLIHLLYTT